MMMRIFFLLLLSFLIKNNAVDAWILPSLSKTTTTAINSYNYPHRRCAAILTKLDAAVGIFYGTSTGNTFDCAQKIYEAFGSDVAAEPVDIDSIDKDTIADSFAQHDALIVGTPTWNTGADKQRSGTGWDEIYYTTLPSMKEVLQNKKVAVFGLGDQSSYGSNFADATGELYDVFTNAGCTMIDASWSQEGYEHEASKSVRDDKFCGLILDMVNQEELTDERVTQWVAQLIKNGILSSSDASEDNSVAITPKQQSSVSSTTSMTPPPPPLSMTATGISSQVGMSLEERIRQLELENLTLKQQIETTLMTVGGGKEEDDNDYTPHYNPVTGKTMWTSSDGHRSYFT